MKSYFNTNTNTTSTTDKQSNGRLYKTFRNFCLLVIVASLLMSGLFIADRNWQSEMAQAAAQAQTEEVAEIEQAQVDAPWYHQVCATVGSAGRTVNNHLPSFLQHLVYHYEAKDGAYTPEAYQNYVPEF